MSRAALVVVTFKSTEVGPWSLRISGEEFPKREMKMSRFQPTEIVRVSGNTFIFLLISSIGDLFSLFGKLRFDYDVPRDKSNRS